MPNIKHEDRVKLAKMAKDARAKQKPQTAMDRILEAQMQRPSLKPRNINARVFPNG